MSFASPLGGLIDNAVTMRSRALHGFGGNANQLLSEVSHHREEGRLHRLLRENQFVAEPVSMRPREFAEVELSANSPELLLWSNREPEQPAHADSERGWDFLTSLIGSVEAPADWATEHDHYLYGSPRRYER